MKREGGREMRKKGTGLYALHEHEHVYLKNMHVEVSITGYQQH